MRPKIDALSILCDTVELHLAGLIGTASHTDMHQIRITEFFFENKLHWQSEVEQSFYKRLF
jgi:hypothetical protein